MTEVTPQKIQEWKDKYGEIFLVEAQTGEVAYLFDPMSKLPIVKGLMAAILKGNYEFVDALINNCWIDGDEAIRTNDKIKVGLYDQVKDIIDIPEPLIEFNGDKAIITIDEKSIEVRLATRQELKYAEDRNKGSKPLDTEIYLLEKIADPEDLKEWRGDTKRYIGLLTAIDRVKSKTFVSIKKL